MNFDYSDDQQAIKRTAHDLLVARFKPDTVRELAEGERYDDAHWDELCELGWPGIFVDEEHGGQGLGTVELVILMEELGYTLAPVPFLSNVAAGLALQHARQRRAEGRAGWRASPPAEARGTVGTLRERCGRAGARRRQRRGDRASWTATRPCSTAPRTATSSRWRPSTRRAATRGSCPAATARSCPAT